MTDPLVAELLQEAVDRKALAPLLRELNPRIWAEEIARINLPKTGRLDFVDHPFMRDVYEDLHPDIVVIKGAQLGFSVWSICRAMWAATQFSLSVIYTFPTGSDVSQFTQARINPIILGSRYLAERIVDVNSVFLKQFSRVPAEEYKKLRSSGVDTTAARMSTVYFSGAQTDRDAQSIDADLLIHDEEDRSNPKIIDQLQERLAHSRTKWRIRLSTPTTPGAGVDKTWRESDQRAWMHRCSRCNHRFEMRFPTGIGDPESCILPYTWEEVVAGAEAMYICPKCRRELSEEDRRAGEWVAAYPERQIHGYHVSQMSAPWVSAKSILNKKTRYAWEADFWNLVMGIPWEEGTNAMTRAALLGPPGTGVSDPVRTQELRSATGSYMGIDVGLKLDVVIERMIDGKPRIIRIARLSRWDELDDLMQLYAVVSCVIDSQPDAHQARMFADRYPGVVWRCVYGGGREVKWDEKNHVVSAPRTEILTKRATELLGTPGILPRYDASPDYEDFIKHHEASKKVAVFVEGLEKERIVERYEWRETGPDHLFHAGAYAMLARLGYGGEGVPQIGLVTLNRSLGTKVPHYDSPYTGPRAIMGRRMNHRH